VVRRRSQPAAGACPQGRAPPGALLTVSLHGRNGPLTGQAYRRRHGAPEPVMRLIVALTAALTVLVLVLPVHP
jgi:hypothetical protein